MLVLVLTPERDAEDRTKNRSGTKVDFSPGVKIVLQRNNKSDSRPRAEMVTPYSIQRYYLYFNSGSTEQLKEYHSLQFWSPPSNLSNMETQLCPVIFSSRVTLKVVSAQHTLSPTKAHCQITIDRLV